MKKIITSILRRFNYEIKAIEGLVINKKIYPDFSDNDIELMNFVRPYTMTSPERMFSLIKAMEYIENANIEGDVVECGVWKGGSSMIVAKKMKELQKHPSRKLYMYDTYEGMNEPTAEDVQYDGQGAKNMLDTSDKFHDQIWCYSALDEVKANMQKTGINMEQVVFVEGKVEDTIPNTIPEKIALLRLDTDWYESTLHEMNHLFPLLVKGGILIIDDYGHWQGARKAIDEYVKKHQVNIFLNRIDYTGRIGIKA